MRDVHSILRRLNELQGPVQFHVKRPAARRQPPATSRAPVFDIGTKGTTEPARIHILVHSDIHKVIHAPRDPNAR